MKTIPTILAVLALSPAAIADDYTLFRVCQDQHIIRTSDGAEVGHVEYIVIEPASHRIISTIVTGGDVGDRFVAVPFEAMTFGADREIMLTEITRERIISAPVIERSQIATTTRIQSSLLDRTSEHFGVRFDANGRERERRDGGRYISTHDRNASQRNRSDSADKAQPGQERGNAQGRSLRDTEKPQARSSPDTPPTGRSVPESTQERNASQRNRSDSADKEQPSQDRGNAPVRSPRDNTEPGKGRIERDVPKPQTRATPSIEKVTPERPTEKSAERSEYATEKVPSKTPRKPEKPEKENKRNTPPN